MTSFKRIDAVKAARPQLQDTAEDKYWKSFKKPVRQKNFGPITCVSISPEGPHDIAATSSKQIVIYSGKTRTPKRTLRRFQGTASSGRFRGDGRLLVCGDGSTVKVLDVATAAMLRQLKGHTAAINVATFSVARSVACHCLVVCE